MISWEVDQRHVRVHGRLATYGNEGIIHVEGYGLARPHCASYTAEQGDSMIKVNMSFLFFYIFFKAMCATCWLVWCMDTCRPRETKAYSFLASARGLGYRAMAPYLWSWDHRCLEWNGGSLWPAWRDHQLHLCRWEGSGPGPLFCSQKVWNCQVLTLARAEYIASSKQSPTSCLHVARVFSLKLEVWCMCTVFPR